jgi:hypothetical protein
MVNITQYRWRASNGPMCWNVYLETAIKAYSGRPYTKVSAMHMDWHDLCHYNLKKYSSLSMPLTGAFCCHQYAFHIYVWSLRIFPTHVKEVRDKYELEAFPSDWPGAWSVPPVNERVGVLCLWHQFRRGVIASIQFSHESVQSSRSWADINIPALLCTSMQPILERQTCLCVCIFWEVSAALLLMVMISNGSMFHIPSTNSI